MDNMNQEASNIKTEAEENVSEKLNIDISIEPPEEPLLGSVTTYSIIEGPELKGQQLRSSARVFKKMKLDSTAPLVPEKLEKKDDCKQDIKKCFRPLWTSDDKTIFFEALNEFGKDFESIQLHISNKLRKKGFPDHLIKTKDQVRHLYHRSWHKISKYLKFAEGVKKVVQELYGLINYGELRKKLGSVSEKSLLKLNELIYRGSTMLRIKGKTVRVKTPMCRALRKLNQLDEKYDEINLPNRLTVDLRPKDMLSFLKVQSTAQNPRLRITLPLQKRLSGIITCVEKKWKSVDARAYDKALISSNPITDTCIPPDKVTDATKKVLNPSLRLTPPFDCRIEIPSINLSEYFTRQSICLFSYENRIGITNTDYSSFYNYNTFKLMKNNSRKASRLRADSINDKPEISPPKTSSQTDDNDTSDINEPNLENKVENDAANMKSVLRQSESCESVGAKPKDSPETKNEIDQQKQERINAIRKGWTEKDSESLTVGEIYLMCGSDSKLILEYSWDLPDKITEDVNTNAEQSSDANNEYTKNLDLSEPLSKLLSVAKLHYRKNIIKCPCGHVCGVKNNAQLKRAVESKIRKILTDIDKCADESDDKATTEENIFETNQVYLPASYFHQPKTPMVHLASQIDSFQRLKPRYCNRRGRRTRSKQVVVERKLPLLPNRLESGHQIVRMNIISQDESKFASNSEEQVNFAEIVTASTSQDSMCSTDMIKSRVAMENSAPPSPSVLLKEDDQWINSEVADYSLSSLLGHLESPMKRSPSATNLTNEDSRLSQDVDAQLHSLLTQSSVDFSASFADLAAQVTDDIKK